jgi:hypothetical protein
MIHWQRLLLARPALAALGALAVISATGVSGAADAQASAVSMPVEPADFPAVYSRTIGNVSVLQVRPDVYLLTAGQINTVLQTGPDGAIVVDPGPAAGAEQMLQAIRAVTSAPIRYIINTSADPELTGANATISAAGYSLLTNQRGRVAPILMRQNALLSLLSSEDSKSSASTLVVNAFDRQEFSFFFNGQAVHIIGQPAAYSSADAVVQFQRSDVVVTGRIFDDTAFPVINRSAGGSLQGEIDALNGLINGVVTASVPIIGKPAGSWQQAPAVASLVIPVRGPLTDQQDLANYRDMVMTVQARVADLVRQRKSEAQVQAENPLQGFETRYTSGGSEAGAAFVKAVYLSLKTPSAGGRP